jgi:hypothetical protein
MKMFLRFLVSALIGLTFATAQARVTGVQVLSRVAIPSNAPDLPAYEKIEARVRFAVNPNNEHNRRVVDLDKADRNAQGEVEFSADLFLMRPISGGNGALLLEIPNRGGKGILSLVDGGKANPSSEAELGDAWLLKRGFTFASLGWQWDVVERPGSLRLYAPVAHDAGGKAITGLLRDDFTLNEAANEVPLGHIMGNGLGGTEYAVSAPEDPRNVLTVRDAPHGARRVIPRGQWSFAHTVDGKVEPSDRFLRLAAGFAPGKIYELVYVVQDPVVAGIGICGGARFCGLGKAFGRRDCAGEGGVCGRDFAVRAVFAGFSLRRIQRG